MRTSLIALAITALPIVASAGPIEIKLAGMGSNEGVTLNVLTAGGVRQITTSAGEINWLYDSDGVPGLDASFYSYCIDLLQYAQGSQTVTQEILGNFAVEWLYNQFAAAAHVNSSMAAGLQLAIWNVLYDTDYSVQDGAFWLVGGSAGARSSANYFLDLLQKQGTAGALAGDVAWFRTGNNPGQDQIARGPSPVPEPATLLLLGSGIAALAARRRRQRGAA